MAIFNKEENPSQEIETIIGPSVTLEGNVVGNGDVIIEGSIHGTLKTEGYVKIGKDAKVKAEIKGSKIFVAGEVHGNISATSMLELSSTARVIGNIQTQNLSIESGASFQGKSSMGPVEEQQEKNKIAKQKNSQMAKDVK